jgi:hypothetical protein
MVGRIAQWRSGGQGIPFNMGFTRSLAGVRDGIAGLRRRMPRASPATVLRVLLWVVIAAAVGAYVWVIWTETISRR